MAGRTTGILLDAWAVAPPATQWICLATLAIRARLQASVFQDLIVQFPRFGRRTQWPVGSRGGVVAVFRAPLSTCVSGLAPQLSQAQSRDEGHERPAEADEQERQHFIADVRSSEI
jgi:hypothetical protein